MDEAVRRCSACGQSKPLSEFNTYPRNGRRYVRGRCKACERAYNLEWRKADYHRKHPNAPYQHKAYFDAARGAMMKECARCHEVKSIDDFHKSAGNLRPLCQPCERERRRELYQSDPDRYRAYAMSHYYLYSERCQKRHHRWLARHRKEQREYYRRYYQEHAESRRAYSRTRVDYRAAWYRRHRRDQAIYHAQWEILNRDRFYEKEARRRAHKAGSPIIDLLDRLALYNRDNWTCYLCGIRCTRRNITLDHIIPLSRGGAHTVENQRVACRSCNSKKGAKLLDEMNIAS